MKRKIYTDGNGSSLIMVEGLGEYVPKSEFIKLKAELEQHDDQITNIEIVNQELLSVADAKINKLVDENNGLKAQFAAVKYLIDGAYCENSENNAGLERLWLNQLYRMIDTDIDGQCLADVKADAGKAGFYEGFSRSGQGFNDEHGCESIELETMANLYANELREQK